MQRFSRDLALGLIAGLMTGGLGALAYTNPTEPLPDSAIVHDPDEAFSESTSMSWTTPGPLSVELWADYVVVAMMRHNETITQAFAHDDMGEWNESAALWYQLSQTMPHTLGQQTEDQEASGRWIDYTYTLMNWSYSHYMCSLHHSEGKHDEALMDCNEATNRAKKFM